MVSTVSLCCVLWGSATVGIMQCNKMLNCVIVYDVPDCHAKHKVSLTHVCCAGKIYSVTQSTVILSGGEHFNEKDVETLQEDCAK